MKVHLERSLSQSVPKYLEEKRILEASAAQADAIQFVLFPDFFRELRKEHRKASVKAATDIFQVRLAVEITQKRLEERPRSDLPARPLGNQV